MMKKLLLGLLVCVQLWLPKQEATAQSGLFPAWTVLGNPSASAALSQSATITQMLDGAFCGTTNAILQRGASVWACVVFPYTATTWTPTLQGSTGAGAPTYTTQSGSYEQIGRQVTVRFNILTTGLGGPTGVMQIGGLPVASASTTSDNGECAAMSMTGVTLDASFTYLVGDIIPGTSVIRLFEVGSGQTATLATVAKFGAATGLQGSCTYHN